MVEHKYSQVSLPRNLVDLIDKEIQDSKLGYRSRAEFVSDLIRKALLGKRS